LSFVERHGLWSPEQMDAAVRLRRLVEEQKLEVIRLSFPDQHGILRGKTLVASEALRCLESGCTITTTMFAKDTSHRTVFCLRIFPRLLDVAVVTHPFESVSPSGAVTVSATATSPFQSPGDIIEGGNNLYSELSGIFLGVLMQAPTSGDFVQRPGAPCLPTQSAKAKRPINPMPIDSIPAKLWPVDRKRSKVSSVMGVSAVVAMRGAALRCRIRHGRRRRLGCF